jgi:hypothetical protein
MPSIQSECANSMPSIQSPQIADSRSLESALERVLSLYRSQQIADCPNKLLESTGAGPILILEAANSCLAGSKRSQIAIIILFLCIQSKCANSMPSIQSQQIADSGSLESALERVLSLYRSPQIADCPNKLLESA